MQVSFGENMPAGEARTRTPRSGVTATDQTETPPAAKLCSNHQARDRRRARRLLNRSARSFSNSSPRLKNRANPSRNTTAAEYKSKTNPPPRAHENEGAQAFSSRGRSIPLGHSLADLSGPPPAFSARPAFRLSDLRTLPPGQPPHTAGATYRFTFP